MAVRKKVLITPTTFAELDSAPVDKLIQCGFEVVANPFKRKLTAAELKELLPGVTGLIAGLETIDREIMAGSRLKVISRLGAGVSNVDLEAARELGIAVRNTPEAPTVSVAELTVGAMIGLLRDIPAMDKALHNRQWSRTVGMQLSGKTVVIIGFGRIGRNFFPSIRTLLFFRKNSPTCFFNGSTSSSSMNSSPLNPRSIHFSRSFTLTKVS